MNYVIKPCLKKCGKIFSWAHNIWDTLPLSLLNEIERLLCEGALTEKELHVSMINVVQEKAPGIDGLTKEFYSWFSEELKEPFANSIRATKWKMALFLSQKQIVIKLMQKKDRDKRFTKIMSDFSPKHWF